MQKNMTVYGTAMSTPVCPWGPLCRPPCVLCVLSMSTLCVLWRATPMQAIDVERARGVARHRTHGVDTERTHRTHGGRHGKQQRKFSLLVINAILPKNKPAWTGTRGGAPQPVGAGGCVVPRVSCGGCCVVPRVSGWLQYW